jgi:hypothetical protein
MLLSSGELRITSYEYIRLVVCVNMSFVYMWNVPSVPLCFLICSIMKAVVSPDNDFDCWVSSGR